MTLAPWAPYGSHSVLVVPPVEEPLTLDDAKLRAGLAWATTVPADPRDAMLADFISAARSQVERDTGLALLTQTRDVHFLTAAGGMVALPSQALPLQSIETITPAGGAPRRVTALDVITDQGLSYARVPELEGVTEGVARCVVGWVNRADLRASAPLLLQAVGLLTAHLATTGRDAVISGTIASENPIGYEDCIASYRLVWLV